MPRVFLLGLFAMAACSLPLGEPAPGKLRLALIADCQYADADSRGVRHYRDAAGKLQQAVDTLSAEEPDAALNLGDLIDKDWASFDVVVPLFEQLPCPVYHVLGNHDFDVAEEHKLGVPERLGLSERYYSTLLSGGWKLIVLDGNDFSYSAWPDEHPRAMASRTFHEAKNSASATWNGGVGPEQLSWLQSELTQAAAEGTPVVVACHFPLWPQDRHNLWNDEEVLEVLLAHPVVKLYLSGHNHAGRFGEREGLPFVTLEGMLDHESNAFAMLELEGDRATITGWGRATSRELKLR